MASWDLTTDAYPIFASKNYLTQDAIDFGTFTADEMQALLLRVIDGDPFSYWSDSSGSDGTTVVLTFSMQDGAGQIERSPDLILLQNINWKNFIGEWSTNGSDWTPYSTTRPTA